MKSTVVVLFVSLSQRYRIFLFPGKSLHATHSLDLREFSIFFYFLEEKKKYKLFYFFPRKSLQATHSKKIRYLQKKGQKKVLYAVFRNFSNFGGVFFFSICFPKI